jgi:hypothetical protein
MAPPLSRGRQWAIGWALAFAALLIAKWPTLGDPHYWDALGCYVAQSHYMADVKFNWSAYALPYVRPPLYTGVLAAVIALISPARQLLHVLTLAWVALALPATWFITRRLGGSVLSSGFAAVLCLLTPVFFSQAGMAQTDLPAAALVAVGWVLALEDRRWRFAVVASLAVLTKESSYFICAPAALLFYLRGLPEGGRVDVRAALRAAPAAALPCVALAGWLVAHRALTGRFMGEDHVAAVFNLGSTAGAFLHNFIEGGRVVLFAFMLFFLVSFRRSPDGARKSEVWTTALVILALPILFGAGQPRYMLPSLPMMCALAALGVSRLPSRARHAALVALPVVSVLGWFGESWHANHGCHLESNLAYRQLLDLQVQAARALAAEKPRRVFSDFPMISLLRAPPGDGHLAQIIPNQPPRGDEPLAELCTFDYLIESDGGSVAKALDTLRAAHAVTLWRQFGERGKIIGSRPGTPSWAITDHTIRVYRIDCPPARN